eukprot:Gb_13349 [translate_table: standard]
MAPTRLKSCLLLLVWVATAGVCLGNGRANLHRSDFPKGFVFGTSSSAYQYEGAAAEDGRGPSIWDTFTHEGDMPDGSTGDVAVDEYHRYKEDVRLMSEMGMDAYRFSISWSRLIPGISLPLTRTIFQQAAVVSNGRGPINPKGLEYYNNLINELLDHGTIALGIQPYITLYHFDLPQSLEDEYGGWVSSKIVEDFVAYADVCFKEFGDRVKNWITFNEPNAIAPFGYDVPVLPPKHCSVPRGHCLTGNSTTEPYIVGHHILLSHAATKKRNGSIGLVILAEWLEPLTNTTADITATQRAIDFTIGWFLDPIAFGDYPKIMREIVGSRLPSFTAKQTEQLIRSFDFFGINHYSTLYAADPVPSPTNSSQKDYITDMSIYFTRERNGIPIINTTKFPGFGFAPWGMQAVLEYIKKHYHNPPVLVAENGVCEGYAEANSDSIPLEKALKDTKRIEYHHDYLQYLVAAIRNGSDTRGYFVWTLLDDFEYLMGYTTRFGLYYVDFNNNLNRYPKLSARWFRQMLVHREVHHSQRLYINVRERISDM